MMLVTKSSNRRILVCVLAYLLLSQINRELRRHLTERFDRAAKEHTRVGSQHGRARTARKSVRWNVRGDERRLRLGVVLDCGVGDVWRRDTRAHVVGRIADDRLQTQALGERRTQVVIAGNRDDLAAVVEGARVSLALVNDRR